LTVSGAVSALPALSVIVRVREYEVVDSKSSAAAPAAPETTPVAPAIEKSADA